MPSALAFFQVIGNMCRLVTEAEDVAPFIPMLLPALKRAADETADLEAAGEAKSAVDALVKALGVGHVADRAKAGLSGAFWNICCVGFGPSRETRDIFKYS